MNCWPGCRLGLNAFRVRNFAIRSPGAAMGREHMRNVALVRARGWSVFMTPTRAARGGAGSCATGTGAGILLRLRASGIMSRCRHHRVPEHDAFRCGPAGHGGGAGNPAGKTDVHQPRRCPRAARHGGQLPRAHMGWARIPFHASGRAFHRAGACGRNGAGEDGQHPRAPFPVPGKGRRLEPLQS